MKAGKLMETAIVTLRRETTLAEIYSVMTQYRQTDFPVMDEQSQLVGMLYEEDIFKALNGSFHAAGGLAEFTEAVRRTVRALNVRADEIMTPDIGWIGIETDVGKIAAVMEEKKVRCLPVYGAGHVLGIVTERSIFMELLKQGIGLKGSPDTAGRTVPGKTPPGVERRRHPRKQASFKLAYKPVSFKLTVHTTDAQGNPVQQARIARCLNLSLGGMLIHTSELSSEDDVLDLAFEIPLTGIPIRRLARVTRALPAPGGGYNLGLMFLALSVQESAALLNYLKSLPD